MTVRNAAPERLRAPVQVRSVNKEDLTVDIVASTSALDSYRTRIDQEGWDLERFRRNPVICYAHDAGGGFFGGSVSGGLPIANALPETIRVEDNKLKMRIRFTPKDVNEFGYKVFRMIEAGFIHAVSVGFDPLEWEDTEEVINGERSVVRVFKRQRLMEVSVVTIPANDEAIVQRARDLNREGDVEQFRTLAAEIESEARGRAARHAETVDDVLNMLDDCPAKDLIIKHRSYFERKRPVNKAAARVMVKYYQRVLGVDQPDEELEAWETMERSIEATTPVEIDSEDETVEESGTLEVPTEEPAAPAAPTETPPAAAPQIEQKASVHIPLSVLKALPGAFVESAVKAAVEASRQGVPVSQVGDVVDELGKSLSHSFSPPSR